jgi:hypothetical protein
MIKFDVIHKFSVLFKKKNISNTNRMIKQISIKDRYIHPKYLVHHKAIALAHPHRRPGGSLVGIPTVHSVSMSKLNELTERINSNRKQERTEECSE